MRHLMTIAFGAALAVATTGCNSTAGNLGAGAAIGAGGAGAAYEYQNRKALEELEEDFEDGKIDREEYLERKREIEKRSVVY